eukprot:3450156-Amphidinium_carterae.1
MPDRPITLCKFWGKRQSAAIAIPVHRLSMATQWSVHLAVSGMPDTQITLCKFWGKRLSAAIAIPVHSLSMATH